MKKLLTGDNILSIIEKDIELALMNSVSQPKSINVYLNPKTIHEILKARLGNKAELSSSTIFEHCIGKCGYYCTLRFIACYWINEYEYDYSYFN